MADPITLTALAVGGLAGSAAGGLFSGGGGSQPAPAAQTALPPDPSTPASTPGSKPAPKKSQQQSFLSGAANLQRSGAGAASGVSGGKTLLGQ